jgi:hypothetical protein
MIDTMHGHWHDWRESIPSYWGRYGIAVCKRKNLTVIRARAELVSARTALVNAARGLVKSYGQRLPKCGTQQVGRELAAALSTELRDVLEPLLKQGHYSSLKD